MTHQRLGPRARAAVLGGVAVVLLAIALGAAAIGPWTAVDHSLEPLDPVSVSLPSQSLAPAPNIGGGGAGDGVDFGPAFRLVALILGGIAVLALLVFVVLYLRNRIRWASQPTAATEPALTVTAAPPPPPPTRSFETRAAADYVIACWEELERAGGALGRSRRPEQTPTEFLHALAAIRPVDAAAGAELLRLYQRARFDHSILEPNTVERSAIVLTKILTALRTVETAAS